MITLFLLWNICFQKGGISEDSPITYVNMGSITTPSQSLIRQQVPHLRPYSTFSLPSLDGALAFRVSLIFLSSKGPPIPLSVLVWVPSICCLGSSHLILTCPQKLALKRQAMNWYLACRLNHGQILIRRGNCCSGLQFPESHSSMATGWRDCLAILHRSHTSHLDSVM